MKVIIPILISFFFLRVQSANILSIFHYPSKSHYLLGSALLKELAHRGHNVTMLSPFEMKEKIENYTNLQLEDMVQYKEENMKKIVENKNQNFIKTFQILIKSIGETCEKFFENPVTQNLLKSNSKYDLVILNWVLSEALLGISYKFNATTIAFSPVGASPYVNYLTGSTAPYSYVPNLALPFSDDMNFLQRVANTIMGIFGELMMDFWFIPDQTALLNKYFPNGPSLEELVEDVDLVLANSHVALESPRPYLPNVIPIGGFYLEKLEELSGDLKDILDAAKEGVVYFSLGTNIQSNSLSKDTLDEIVEALGKIPFEVLWKFEGEDLPNRPKNVHVRKWLPQKCILSHENTKIFITHGGLGSVVEALYYGVPVIGIPFFGDQRKNMVDTVNQGFGILVDSTKLSGESLLEAIGEIQNISKYKENVEKRSSIFRDQPMSPMDKAVFWIEHVIKHKGAKHMKAKVKKLSWYQYFLLDVIGFLAVIISATLGLLYFAGRSIFRFFWSKKTDGKIKTN